MATTLPPVASGQSTEASKTASRNRLDQQQFMNLMMTQLKNQDPTKPLDSTQLYGQLAQFSTVAGVADLQASFSQFAASMQSNQALQASSLIGRRALAPGETGVLGTDGLAGTVSLPGETASLRVGIFDPTGQLVRRLELGAQAGGTVQFKWDGLGEDGLPAAPGLYRIRAEATLEGEAAALATSIWTAVESVMLGAAGSEPTLNLVGLGAVPFSRVTEVR